MIKTFRGLLTDSSPGNQNRIRLQTIKGKVGYKIVKFEVMPTAAGTTESESTVLIFKEKQTSVSATVNFTNQALLGAAFFGSPASVAYGYGSASLITIFDNEIFNQDIYITHTDTHGAISINYYIELEVIPLDDAGAEYTTLKDMRST